MPFEDDLGAALRRTADALSTDTASLAAAGLARGRALRRRRRAAAVTGAFVAVTAACVAAVLVVPAGTARQAVPAVTAPAKEPAKVPPATPAGRPQISDQEMLTLFKALLPKGSVTGGRARGTQTIGSGNPVPYAEFVFDDGKGAATVSVDLSRDPDDQRQDNQCPDPAFMKKGTKCARTQLPDGSVLTVVQGWEYQDARTGPKNWRAVLTTPEGGRIGASEWNAAGEKGVPQTRPEPPLTPAQLGAIVRSSSWDKVFEAFPESDADTAPAS
ncbi:hypothetical protein ACIP98_35735 [Streptomyces sp. NPDC088354]|uniref:hypothetical protein n=1 Tax=Streptomyces sp. NPDC088354 TaxID=3365856 RepID=UPI0038195B8E